MPPKMPPAMAFLSPRRIIALSVAFFLLLVFIISALREGSTPIQKFKDVAQSAADGAKNFCSNDNVPHFSKPTFHDSVFSLYEAIRHPITAETYVDAYGVEFNNSENAIWTKSLGSDILIVDMDTRVPNGEGQIFDGAKDAPKMNWEALDAKDTNLVSMATMNHYLYSQIHGYDYKFYAADHIPDHHDTWIKPHVLAELLHSYRFVVFIDADATVMHLEVPLEWMFNRWNITPNTSIAMPLDTMMRLNDDDCASCDSKGRRVLNSGFVVAQSLPHTFDMMNAWSTCTDETRYPGCGKWKETWSHEQRAFNEYIRYDFNPNNNIVELPCDDAMGYPGIFADNDHILSDCNGQFIRHHTLDKGMTKTSSGNAVLQSMTELMQKALFRSRKDVWVSEGGKTRAFMEKFETES